MTNPPRKFGVQSSFGTIYFLEPPKSAGADKADQPAPPADESQEGFDPYDQSVPEADEAFAVAPHDKASRKKPEHHKIQRRMHDGLGVFRPGQIGPDGRSFENCIDDLQKALDLVERGDLPNLNVLDQAPILHHWVIVQTHYNPDYLMMMGWFENHPTIKDGRSGYTSPLMVIDGENPPTWARTWSRWYRLGKPLFATDAFDQGSVQ